MKHLALLFCAFVFTSFTACKKDTEKTVQFEATYTTTNELLEPAPMLKQRITGTGQSNNLNIVKFVAISTMNTTTQPPFSIGGSCTYYADNGDEFYTTHAGTSAPNADGTLTVKMTHTITGGTGKFKNAKGTLTGETIANPRNPTNTIIVKGDITY
jgi:hypothetical protein